MNRKAIIVATTLALAGLSGCNALQTVESVNHVISPSQAHRRPVPTTTTVSPWQGSCPWVNEGTWPNEYPVQHCELLDANGNSSVSN